MKLFHYVKKGNTVLQKGILSFADIKKGSLEPFFENWLFL